MVNNNPQQSGKSDNAENEFQKTQDENQTLQGASGNKEADLVNTTGGQGKMGNIDKQKKHGGSVPLEGNA